MMHMIMICCEQLDYMYFNFAVPCEQVHKALLRPHVLLADTRPRSATQLAALLLRSKYDRDGIDETTRVVGGICVCLVS